MVKQGPRRESLGEHDGKPRGMACTGDPAGRRACSPGNLTHARVYARRFGPGISEAVFEGITGPSDMTGVRGAGIHTRSAVLGKSVRA